MSYITGLNLDDRTSQAIWSPGRSYHHNVFSYIKEKGDYVIDMIQDRGKKKGQQT